MNVQLTGLPALIAILVVLAIPIVLLVGVILILKRILSRHHATTTQVVQSASAPTPSAPTLPTASPPSPAPTSQPTSLSLPKLFGIYGEAKGIVGGTIFLMIAIGLAYWAYYLQHQPTVAILLLVPFGGFSILIIILSILSIRRLIRSSRSTPDFTHFDTSTAITFKSTQPSAVAEPDEKIFTWLGPVFKTGLSSYGNATAKEVFLSVANTFLFTNRQIIGIMLGPNDMNALQSGNIQAAFGKFIEYSPGTEFDKNYEFTMSYKNRWHEMVEILESQPLSMALQSHLNFGVPYENIRDVSIKTGLFSRGLTINLLDGSKISYSHTNTGRLRALTSALAQYVKVD